jgi:hypothetical protein
MDTFTVCRQMGLKEHLTLAFDLVDEIDTALFMQVSGQLILLIFYHDQYLIYSQSYWFSVMLNSVSRFYVSIRTGRNVRIFGSQLHISLQSLTPWEE